MIILYGPTGVGKTDLSLLLARYLTIEIITMDSGSFYEPLTIGTAKPDWKHQPVRHHLFDTVTDPDIPFSVMDFRRRIAPLLDEIKSRNAVPVLVGGSGFYLKSLFFPALETQSRGTFQSDAPTHELWQQLFEIDPVRAHSINRNDRYRILRALALWFNTGTLPSELAPVFDPIARAFIIHMTRERQDLYNRINQRVLDMILQGWIQEVAQLSESWKSFVLEKKVIGYDDILRYLEHNGSQEFLIKTIQTKTRNYAKRQETFWRMLQKQLQQADPQETCVKMETLNLTYTNVELYIKQLLQEITDFLMKKGLYDR